MEEGGVGLQGGMFTEQSTFDDRGDHHRDEDAPQRFTTEIVEQFFKHKSDCCDWRVERCRDTRAHTDRNHRLYAQLAQAEDST